MFCTALEQFKHREAEPVGFTSPGNVNWATMTGCLIKSMGRVITLTMGGEDYLFKLVGYDQDKNLRMRKVTTTEGVGTKVYVVCLVELDTITFPGWDRSLKGEKKT